MSDFDVQSRVDLEGNLIPQSKRMAGAVAGLASKSARSFRAMRSAASMASKGIDRLGNRYTGLASAMVTGSMARGIITLDKQLKHLEVRMDLTAEQAAKLKENLFEVSNHRAVRMDVSELVAGVTQIVELTGDMQFAQDNMMNMGVAARSSGAAVADIATVIANLRKIGITSAEGINAALTKLIAQGDKGSVGFAQLAAEFGPLASQMKGFGLEGQSALDFLGAVMQTTQNTTESAAETGTAITALFKDIDSKGAQYAKRGIKLFDENENRRAVDDILKDLFARISKIEGKTGQNIALRSMFGDESFKAVTQLWTDYQKDGDFTMLNSLQNMQVGSGEMRQDAIEQTKTFAVALETLTSASTRFADAKLSKPIQELADAITTLSSEDLSDVFDFAGDAAMAAAGIWAVNKAMRGTAAGIRFVQGLRRGSGAGGKAAGALASASATPVIVTNWPAGSGGSWSGMSGKKSRKPIAGRRLSLSSNVGRLANLGKFARGVGPLSAILGAVNMGSALMDGDMRGIAGGVGSMGGAWGGAAAGAALGSIIPGIGTAIGGLVGAGLGGILGDSALTGLFDLLNTPATTTPATPQPDKNNEQTLAALGQMTAALEDNTRTMQSTARRSNRGHGDIGAMGGMP